jgi:AcrR family transcriptional regulator
MSVLSRRTRTEQTRRANEAALLTAAIALIEEGAAFAELGIEQIVRRAGLSRPTFYTYFRDKRDLLMRLGEALERDLAAVSTPWFEGEADSARETIAAVLAVFTRHRAAARALAEAATYDPEIAGFWRGFHERFLPAAERRIMAGDPGLDPAGVVARAYALIYMTERTMVEQVTHRIVLDEALIDQLTWLWERAVGE